MIVAAHQPNYLPWLGFFDRIRRADKFLILDHVQFERQNYQNRTRLFINGETRWLTVPVVQKSRDERIIDKEIANEKDGKFRWGRKSYTTLEGIYRGAPYFQLYAPYLRSVFAGEWTRLVDLNITLIRFCMDALEIKTPIERTSQMKGVDGQKSELVLSMCKAAGAKTYLSGEGASRDYLDLEAFKKSGLEVAWQQFKHPDYPQIQRPAGSAPVHGLSVLDLLFNCGPHAKDVLKGETAHGIATARPAGDQQLVQPASQRAPARP